MCDGPETRHPRARHRQRPAWRRLHQGRAPRGAGCPAPQLAHHAAHACGQFQDRHVRRRHDRHAAARQGRPREGAHVPAARHRDGESGQGRARRARSRGQRYRGDRQCCDLSPAGASVMLLYEHPLSSYAQKVKIALREKGLDFKVETPPALGSGKAEGAFAAASPRNEVPALIDGDVRIFDSTIILEYLEDKFPSPPLLPRDPAERARARMIEELCDTSYEAVNWGLSEIRWFKRAEGELAEKMKATAARQTAELQDWLTERLGNAKWFNGPSFGGAALSV